MENRRFRLHFTDRDILTPFQKNKGLNRSWLLLKPHLKTVADLVHYVTRLFRINNSCPDGILLYVDGFVLPEFESVEVVKDKDLICVKRRKQVGNENMRECFEVEGGVERQDLGIDGRLLLGNKEFENEIGGYQSEEDIVAEKTPRRESKKRKADRKDRSPKRMKKRKHIEKITKPLLEEGEIDKCLLKERKVKGSKLRIKKVDIDQQMECSTPADLNIVKRGTRLDDSSIKNMPTKIQEKRECSQDASQLPVDRTKGSSRSARRKKAKRCWLREKLKSENELQQQKAVEKVCQFSAEKNHQESVKKDSENLVDKDRQVSVKKDCQESSEESSEESSDDSSEESSDDSSEESSEEAVMKEDGTKDQPVLHDEDIEDEVIPVEIRPGHIRFESRSKGNTSYHEASQNQNPVFVVGLEDTFHWNGITSKKKGQKWGTAKDTNSIWNDIGNSHPATSRMTTISPGNIVITERCTLDFEKLESYVGLPKNGDVLAYRLMELSSSWCPEVSSFRVGKVSSYDPECNVIRLESVPEYPFTIENRQEHFEEEDGVPEPDPSPYDADGSLEVEFSSIVDPRIIKRAAVNVYSSEVTATKTKGGGGAAAAAEKDAQLNSGSSHTEKKTITPTPANEATGNTWDEVIQVLSAKKQELSAKVNGDGKKQNPGKSPWSYRAMRGSALGPLMARLREQNELQEK